MADSRPITRSVSSQLGLQDPHIDPPKEEAKAPINDPEAVPSRDEEVSHEQQPPTGSNSVAVMAAIQSLGQALEGYSARMSAMEDKLREIPSSYRGSAVQSEVVQRPLPIPPTAEPATPGARVHHLVKPSEFDGSSSWASFIAQFKLIAATQGWNVADKLAILVASLKGPALELFAHLPELEQTDFGRLTNALESRFGVANQEPWFRSQLRRRRRNAGETLPHLAQDIERLVSLSYPSAPVELRKSLACDSFMDALDDTELHIAVRQSRPSSLPQALASAVEIEALRRTAGISSQALHSATLARQGRVPQESLGATGGGTFAESETAKELKEILRLLNNLQKSLSGSTGYDSRGRSAADRFQARDRRGNRTSVTGACWECGTVGHFRRDCPRIPRNSKGPQNPQGNE